MAEHPEHLQILKQWMRSYRPEERFDDNLDRFHLVMDVVDRVPGLNEQSAHMRQRMVDERLIHRAYTRAVGDDPPDVRNWIWPTRVGSGQGQAAISRNGAHI